jgi:REP element-mobilizing transposase RayT
LFGDIVNAQVILSSLGEIVHNEWLEVPNRFVNVQLDEFVIMPNHIHGIIFVGATLVVARGKRAGTRPAPTLGKIVGTFKSSCVHNCVESRLTIRKLWQRNYYEHIIRDEDDLNHIRGYIINNPVTWELDNENPENINAMKDRVLRCPFCESP